MDKEELEVVSLAVICALNWMWCNLDYTCDGEHERATKKLIELLTEAKMILKKYDND